ncbi:transposase [Flavobacterium piscis]|jgi:transposase|uniref:Transposase n=2 Tax=Flavobacterium TaxID=237 RepID=A0ABX2XFS8_9FLAO|nr:transposase [Flavobacterium piscis]QDW19028.1 IS110 family transposase [Flavobacterium sp. KBS0721]QDW19070.1 IS110 family transposase [Flavobacterium sp. KBS0721]QDW19824.1 IS110 family transposase [Flavobacterium sp. KBS0721]QDW22814.1 IS110 family transposase [Flavobacterium sp. KBS0721]
MSKDQCNFLFIILKYGIMNLKYSVGLDVSSKKINACMSCIDEKQKVIVKSSTVISNNKKGFKILQDWVLKHVKENVPVVVCMEATGIYHENCAYYLFEKGFSVSIILPNKAKKYLEAIGLKSKNDSIDAKGLSQMGAEQCLDTWQPMGTFFYELRLYTRQHQNVTELKTVLKNQFDALSFAMHQVDPVTNQLKETIILFDKQLKELEKVINNHIKSDAKIAERVANILEIKGIGILTLATILAETNGFELFNNYKQLVSYAGYDVVEAQSGTRVGKTKISKKGNSRIRRAMHMPSLVVIKCEVKPFKELFERTYNKHGIKMKSYVAVQKKLLTMIYYMWKKKERFEPNYIKSIQEKEQKSFSLFAFEKGIKNSPNKIEAAQGKHPANDHSKFPLC